MEKLAWGRFYSASALYLEVWLRYMVELWVRATHGAEEDFEVQAAYESVTGVISRLNTAKPPALAEDLQEVYEHLIPLRCLLEALSEGNPVLTSLSFEEGEFRMGWSGAWTRGRFVDLRYVLAGGLTVSWDTATGKESTFLSLPSEAVGIANGDHYAELKPFANHLRRAIEKLGGSTSQIPETGVDGIAAARRALDELVEAAVTGAATEVISQGFVPCEE